MSSILVPVASTDLEPTSYRLVARPGQYRYAPDNNRPPKPAPVKVDLPRPERPWWNTEPGARAELERPVRVDEAAYWDYVGGPPRYATRTQYRRPLTATSMLGVAALIAAPIFAVGLMTALIYPELAAVVLVALAVAITAGTWILTATLNDNATSTDLPPHNAPFPLRRRVRAEPGERGAYRLESGKFPPPSLSQHTAHNMAAPAPLGNKPAPLRQPSEVRR